MIDCETNAKCAFKIYKVDTLPKYSEATTLHTLTLHKLRDESLKTFYCKKEWESGFDSFKLGSGSNLYKNTVKNN